MLEQTEIPPEKTLGFWIAESTNIYNAVVNTCKNAGMFLIDEDEMVAKKKYNEGKIDLETLNQILGWNTEDDDDENRDITE